MSYGEWVEPPSETQVESLFRKLKENPGQWLRLTVAEVDVLAGPELALRVRPRRRLCNLLIDAASGSGGMVQNRETPEGLFLSFVIQESRGPLEV